MICVGCIVSSSTIFFLSGEDDVLSASARLSRYEVSFAPLVLLARFVMTFSSQL